MIQLTEPTREHVALSTQRDDGSRLSYTDNRGRGIGIVTPLCFGTTLAGLDRAHGQRAFLDAIGAGYQLVAYDQRGIGASAAADGAAPTWEQRGADLWAVADAAGIERAVLYGVFDAGYTIAHAAAQQPERVLGLIFNLVPARFIATSDCLGGVPSPTADGWLNESGNIGEQAALVLRSIGLSPSDATALAGAWAEAGSPQAFAQEACLLREADLRPLAPRLSTRTLVIEAQRRPLIAGWGRALADLLPSARVITPMHAGEMLGGIHGFLAMIDLEEGRHASRLSPSQSTVVGAAERSVTALRRIVVPIAEDVESERAVEMACRLGALQQAEIVLVHVVEVPLTRSLDAVTQEERSRGLRALALGEAIVARRGMRSRTRLLVERSAAAGITRAAADEGADLIVMAMGERRMLEPSGISRTMREVLHRAPCEVLIDRAHGARV